MSTVQTAWTAADYERSALEYMSQLPLEHFMESLPHSTQRAITVASLALLSARRPEVQVFSELLVQYPFEGEVRRVVPDNMVRLCRQQPLSPTSFSIELEPVGPLLVIEYVSPKSAEKDYEESFAKYQDDLKVPYCLMYEPECERLQVWHHNGRKYELLPANAQGHYAIPELDLEAGLLDGWVRYWHRGELLPLPVEEHHRAERERQRADRERQRADQEREARLAAEGEVTRLRALLAEKEKP